MCKLGLQFALTLLEFALDANVLTSVVKGLPELFASTNMLRCFHDDIHHSRDISVIIEDRRV